VTGAISHTAIERFNELARLRVVRISDDLRGERFDHLGPVSYLDAHKTFQDLDLSEDQQIAAPPLGL
jgi:hypothetical protein